MIELEFFKEYEFECPCCKKQKMDEGFLKKLDKARSISKTSYKINSGYRCPNHNKTVKSTSENHPSGHAADIACSTGWKRLRILRGLIFVGFERIGVDEDFIHVDDMPDKMESVWLY